MFMKHIYIRAEYWTTVALALPWGLTSVQRWIVEVTATVTSGMNDGRALEHMGPETVKADEPLSVSSCWWEVQIASRGCPQVTTGLALTTITLFCLLRRRRSRTSCSTFKMLQHVWSLGPGNISVVCLGWYTIWPALAGYSSASAVQACCDSPSLSSAPSSKVSHRLLCVSLWS